MTDNQLPAQYSTGLSRLNIEQALIAAGRFEFAVHPTGLSTAQRRPAVTVMATAADLITARFGATAPERKAALRRVKFNGEPAAVEAMRTAFTLAGDPGLAIAS